MQSSDLVPLSPFSRLPSDCLVQVFDKLIDSDWRSCRGVCKRWRQILQSPYYRERIERLALSCLFRSEKQGVICGRMEGAGGRIKLLSSFEEVPSILKVSEGERVVIYSFPQGKLLGKLFGKLFFKGKYFGYHRASDQHIFEVSESGSRHYWSAKNPEKLVPSEESYSDLELPKKQLGAAGWKIGRFNLWRGGEGEVTLNCKAQKKKEICCFPVGKIFREKFPSIDETKLELCDVQLNGPWLHVLVKAPAPSMGRLDTHSFFSYTIVGFPLLPK